MVKKEYQLKVKDEKHCAKAVIKNRRVSTKYAVEIANVIKGKPAGKALAFLERVAEKKEYLPLRKYNKKVAHRKGRAVDGCKAGRYPVKACNAFIELLNYAVANAENKGLDTEKLIVRHAFASQGFRRLSHQSKGRIAGKRRERKGTHIEVILQEAK